MSPVSPEQKEADPLDVPRTERRRYGPPVCHLHARPNKAASAAAEEAGSSPLNPLGISQVMEPKEL